jgi:hypothetical protein
MSNEHKMSEQMFTAISVDSVDDYSTLLTSNATLAAAQAAAQADDDEWRVCGNISEPRSLEWRTTANGFEAVGIDTLRYVLTPYNAELASTIAALESVLKFYLPQIAAWPFSGEWPSVVVQEYDNDSSVDMTMLKIVVPLPMPLRADEIEQLANVMLALSTSKLDAFDCAGQRWHIGDGDDTQAAWLDNGRLNVWLRSWPNESADAIQQDQLDGNENSDAIFYMLISECDGEQITFDGVFATAELARAHAATLISDTYGSDAKPLTWHSFDGGYEAELNDDDGAWRFIVLWHFSNAIMKLIS